MVLQKKIPQLRFTEFVEDLEPTKLGLCCEYIKSGKSVKFEDGKYDLYGSTGIVGKTNLNLIKGEFLLVARVGANAGLLNLVKGEFGVSDNTLIVKLKNKLNSVFVKEFLVRYNINKLIYGSGQPLVTSSILKGIKINLPALPEQQKIASFLSAVDKRIELLKKKKDLLEDYKKGVMQQLFSQQIRFKNENGNDFPDWEEKKLRNIAVKSRIKNTDNSISHVLTNSATRGVVSQKDYFDKDIANQSNLEGYYVVKKDDFVYNPRISVSAPVGPIKRNKLVLGVMSPLYTIFRFTSQNLKFIEFYFETSFWHKYMKSVANYGARHDRMNITNEDFFNIPIPCPSEPEQQKIASFLSAIDSKIEVTTQKIDGMQTFKKGLLQQMFV